MKNRKGTGGWSTKDELQFLKDLQNKKPEAFEAYRQNFHRRRDWAGIDKNAIAEYLGIAN